MLELTRVVKALRSVGADVTFGAGANLVVNGRKVELSQPHRAPTPTELDRLVERSNDRLLLVVDRPASSLRNRALADHRLVLVSAREVVLDGLVHFLEPDPPPKRATRGPLPYARFAIGRTLLSRREPWRQTELAIAAGVTQGAVSNALRAWPDLLTSSRSGVAAIDAAALFDYLVAKQPAGGVVSYWWSDRPLDEQATDVESVGALRSGDLAASRIRGWRRPEHVVAYREAVVDLSDLGFVMASRDEYTTQIIVPADPTIGATAAAFAYGTADPIIVASDILTTATWGDQGEAVAVLKAAVLEKFEGDCDA